MHPGTEKEIKSPCPSMGEVINKAALHLPEGYTLRIDIENGGYGVTLFKPDQSFQFMDSDGIIGEINDAICIANGFEAY